jgi:hypothetical protein
MSDIAIHLTLAVTIRIGQLKVVSSIAEYVVKWFVLILKLEKINNINNCYFQQKLFIIKIIHHPQNNVKIFGSMVLNYKLMFKWISLIISYFIVVVQCDIESK